MDEPVMSFKSHIEGKNADVAIYANRVEWQRIGWAGRAKGTETVPMRAITSVATKKDGLRFVVVSLTTAGAVVGFRVDRGIAPQVRDTITELMVP